jgi:hypothetical protein
MKTIAPVIFFLTAIVTLYFGATGKTFRAGGPGRTASGRPLPRWFGRLWFFGFAVVLLYLAIKGLRAGL